MKTIYFTLGFLLLAIGKGGAQELLTREDKDAIRHFDSHLAQCPKNEIRCIWFLNNSVQIGMLMTLDLGHSKVSTVRVVFNLAHQNTRSRALAYHQVKTLKSLLPEIPPSTKAGKRSDSVFISYHKEGKVEVRRFLRTKLPRVVERIYDIGGAQIETTEKKNQ